LVKIRAAGERGQIDLEAWEFALRVAVLALGAGHLSELLSELGIGRQEQPVMCVCGERMESHGVRTKKLLTLLGPVKFARSRYECPACGEATYPGDQVLDVVKTSRSPGLRRLMARAGSATTFKEAREDLKVYAGVTVSAKDLERVAEGVGIDIERWREAESKVLIAQAPLPHLGPPIDTLYISLDGTGVPVVKAAVEGRRGKQEDGSAKTREAKLGCVFTQTSTDDEGRPQRDPQSTTFVGAIEDAESFGWRLFAEAVRRGLKRARRVAVLGDGALWIRSLAQTHFPEATLIVDLYHAREHLSHLAKLLVPQDPRRLQSLRKGWWHLLDYGGIDRILARARAYRPEEPELRKLVQQEIDYFETNRERMQYHVYRRMGLFVGSGVIEAGCKTVIGKRLKQSGMEWSVKGANAIISLRCNQISGRFEDYWEDRVAA
jgi:Uncharacterised protein family (UPF0236)